MWFVLLHHRSFEYPLQMAGAMYRCAPVSMGNTFQDLPQLHETVDNTEHYI
jgi:hypothetical protein